MEQQRRDIVHQRVIKYLMNKLELTLTDLTKADCAECKAAIADYIMNEGPGRVFGLITAFSAMSSEEMDKWRIREIRKLNPEYREEELPRTEHVWESTAAKLLNRGFYHQNQPGLDEVDN